MKRIFFTAAALAAASLQVFADTQTITRTVSPSVTETATQTTTRTVSPSAVETATQTATRTISPSVTETATQTITRTASPSAVETATQTVSFSATETRTLIIINTATATPTKTPDTGAAVPEAGEGAPYPNPGKTGLNTHIFYSIETSGEITVEVYTVDGRKILTDNKGIFSGRGKITVDVSDLGPGVYFVRYRMVPEDAAPAKEKISRFLIKRH